MIVDRTTAAPAALRRFPCCSTYALVGLVLLVYLIRSVMEGVLDLLREIGGGGGSKREREEGGFERGETWDEQEDCEEDQPVFRRQIAAARPGPLHNF